MRTACLRFRTVRSCKSSCFLQSTGLGLHCGTQQQSTLDPCDEFRCPANINHCRSFLYGHPPCFPLTHTVLHQARKALRVPPAHPRHPDLGDGVAAFAMHWAPGRKRRARVEKYRRGSGLEIDVDLEQESREWIVQRIAWLVLTALLAAVALGLFGRGGPLSTSQVRSADGATQVDYQRFIRNHSADTLRISALARDDSVRVSACQRALESGRITKRSTAASRR